MSFLQINNTDPSVKRPFRLSDIQSIWSGISSLFKPIQGKQFRIISGFDIPLEPSIAIQTYSSGVVYFGGQLYEYDSVEFPITDYTGRVFFARVETDRRTFANGASLPFSYKYVCGGGSTPQGYEELGVIEGDYDFIRNIEACKNYLGEASVSISRLKPSQRKLCIGNTRENAAEVYELTRLFKNKDNVHSVYVAPTVTENVNITIDVTGYSSYLVYELTVLFENDSTSADLNITFTGRDEYSKTIKVGKGTEVYITFVARQSSSGSSYYYVPVSASKPIL